MTTTRFECGADALLRAIKVLNYIAEERTTYDNRGREHNDFTALAAKVLMQDQLGMGEPATVPGPLAVERMEEQLTQLFTAAHVISRAYTSLDC